MAPTAAKQAKLIAGGVLFLCGLFALAISPLEAAVADPDHNARRVGVLVIDYDGGVVGASLISFLKALVPVPQPIEHHLPSLEFTHVSADVYPNPDSAVNAVRDGHKWGVIYAAPGASAALAAAVAARSDVGYNPNAAVQFVFDEGRQNVVSDSRVEPLMYFLGNFNSQFAAQAAAALGTSGTNVTDLALSAPSLLGHPVDFTVVTLFPFDVPVITIAQLIGLILACVFSFMIVNLTTLPLAALTAELPPLQKANKLLLLFVLFTMCVSGTSATILMGFADTYKTGTEAKFTGSGVEWAELWSILWLLMLVYTSFFGVIAARKFVLLPSAFLLSLLWGVLSLNLDLASPGYRAFEAAPMLQAATLIRFVFFGSLRLQVGRCVGVLFGWLGLYLALFYCAHLICPPTHAPHKTPGPPVLPVVRLKSPTSISAEHITDQEIDSATTTV